MEIHTHAHSIIKCSECFVTGVTLVGSRSVLVSDLKTSDRHIHSLVLRLFSLMGCVLIA